MSEELFRTSVPCPQFKTPLTHQDSLLVMGSCFAENISVKLSQSLFQVCTNPTGSLFNPLSLAKALERIVSGVPYDASELFEHQGLWHSFDHHSSFSGREIGATLEKMNESLQTAHLSSKNLTTLILTFGTAYTYYLKDSETIVSNCHKISSAKFHRKLMEVEEIVGSVRHALGLLYSLRPDLKVIFTVSPVRHLRDDPRENSVSKASLVCAVDKLLSIFPSAHYFPSYEILLDELRDYRFYARDMAHPSELAIDFIWQRFVQSCIGKEPALFIEEFRGIQRDLNHKIGDIHSEASLKFLESIEKRLLSMQITFPHINFEKPLSELKNVRDLSR